MAHDAQRQNTGRISCMSSAPSIVFSSASRTFTRLTRMFGAIDYDE